MPAPGPITIVSATPADAPAVAAFCQPIYEAVYPNAKYGMKPEHFSREIFEATDTIEYFKSVLATSSRQRAYLAKLHGQIVGTISIARGDKFYEIHAFYVALQLQGQGIGKRIMRRALEFHAGDLPIRVEVAETSHQTIEMYKHWGYKPAPEYGVNWRHWPEWPDGLKNAYIYLQTTCTRFTS